MFFASCNLADVNSNAIFLLPVSPVVRRKNVVSINPPSATRSRALSSSILTINLSTSNPGNLAFFIMALEIAKFEEVSRKASAWDVPINALVPVAGTPLQFQQIVEPEEMIIMIATARIILPKSRIRLSAGRKYLSNETQMLCLLSGANSIFYGDTLLTTKNNDMAKDRELIAQYQEIKQSNLKELINKYLIVFSDKVSSVSY